jgi:hypothetical protein
MAMGKRAGDGERVTIGGDDGAALQHAAQALDMGWLPIGEVAECALTDLAILPVALAKEDGGW